MRQCHRPGLTQIGGGTALKSIFCCTAARLLPSLREHVWGQKTLGRPVNNRSGIN